MIRKERLVSTFLDLVKISSPSWKEEEVFRYIEKAAGGLGLECLRAKCGPSHNLVVRMAGDTSRKPLMFGAHADTVTPCDNVKPVIRGNRITSDGTTILGGDDKAAIAAFIEAMRVIREHNIQTPPIEWVFTCAEEIGLRGMKGMDFSMLKSKRAFIFDCSGPIGTVIARAPSQIIMHVDITGRAAHAGIEPEKGVSAIDIAAEIIMKLPRGRLDKETTSNVGMISGGRATNIVAEKASFDMEARSLDGKKLKTLEKKMIAIIKDTAKKRGGKAQVDSTLEYSSFNIPAKDPLIRVIDSACESIGAKMTVSSSGGGSDTNILNAKGIRAINLSIGMSNVHSTREFLLVSDLCKGCDMVVAIAAVG